MAEQKSMLRYRGSLDGIRHYTVKGSGKDFAAYVRGVDGDRIKNGAEYERTRENMNEFGGCGVAVSSLRNGLAPVIDQVSDKKMSAWAIRIVNVLSLLSDFAYNSLTSSTSRWRRG